MPAKAAAEPIYKGDPHPLAPALIVGGIALVGAVVFAGSVAMWVFFLSNTGVNWMFSTVR